MGGNENRKKYITNKIEYLGRGDKESKPRAVAELLSATSSFRGRRRTRREPSAFKESLESCNVGPGGR